MSHNVTLDKDKDKDKEEEKREERASAPPAQAQASPPSASGFEIFDENPPSRPASSPKPRTRKPDKPDGRQPPDLSDIDPQFLADWQKARNAKRAGPITKTVIDGLRREAAKAGITANKAVECCAEAGWIGFMPKWYANRMMGGGLHPEHGSAPPKTGVVRQFLSPAGQQTAANIEGARARIFGGQACAAA